MTITGIALFVVVGGAAAALKKFLRSDPDATPDNANWMSQEGYAGTMYHGTVYPPDMNVEALDELRATVPFRMSDIVIATYPKCGTTLMQQIVLTLLADGMKEMVVEPMVMSKWAEMTVSNSSVADFNAWEPDPATQRKPPPRRVIKTHAPAHLVPWKGEIPEHGKVIVITRNPADAAVSMHNHSLDIPVFEYSGCFQHFLTQLFIPGKVESGSFWDWHSGWWAKYGENLDRVLWVSYEDFKINPRGVIAKVAKFIDCGASAAAIERTIESSSFGNMRANSDRKDKEKIAAGQSYKKNHIRQGLSGAWRGVFTTEQTEALMHHHEKKCKEGNMPIEMFDFH
jgi:hypothetical protein